MLGYDWTIEVFNGLGESLKLDHAHPMMVAASELEVN